MTQDQLLTLLDSTIPEPEKITHVDTSAPNVVTFLWRGLDFTVNTSLEVTESCLHLETGHAILMQALLRMAHAQNNGAAA